MSWSIWATGTPEAVKKAVTESKAYGDASQMDVAKTFILAEIDAQQFTGEPGTPNGVKVEASGHHDPGNRNVSIKVDRVRLAL